MSDYFAPVNIPSIEKFFDDNDKILNQQSFHTQFYQILETSALSSIAKDFFKSIDVTPTFIVIFTWPTGTNTMDTRAIHRDITLDQYGRWQSLRFALNWEINPYTVTEWIWFDMSALPEVFPASGTRPSYLQKLSGLHYGTRMKRGIPAEAVVLERTKFTGPNLVRVDIPHNTAYETIFPMDGQERTSSLESDSWLQGKRAGCSIRFDESNWHSWEECLAAFKSVLAH